ncbi:MULTISPECIES: hypothetical protein [Xenorhabdus]|uniref:hypothetical protein n=1 Tax=Xenorhabdus TaxID=626 RepID=UPI00117E7806|nr:MULTISPECIES: hypothetical protein [Xenorhabdus]
MKKYALLCLLAGSAILPLQTYADTPVISPSDPLYLICVLIPTLPWCDVVPIIPPATLPN